MELPHTPQARDASPYGAARPGDASKFTKFCTQITIFLPRSLSPHSHRVKRSHALEPVSSSFKIRLRSQEIKGIPCCNSGGLLPLSKGSRT
ncbi:hypothetical protein COLO4_05292 [Corchorus olitorius]|uniref:Uncharacterized protein n=1 Tax=Corchorus olitorius TaxID=93759 RepID=A0A1R3KRD4_9ROSI|nr:hypothetical protein COLO4_05292 [Corchorus olitorius]